MATDCDLSRSADERTFNAAPTVFSVPLRTEAMLIETSEVLWAACWALRVISPVAEAYSSAAAATEVATLLTSAMVSPMPRTAAAAAAVAARMLAI